MKHVLCAGIAVVDQIFRVEAFPRPDVKTQASSFGIVNGGNAANAEVAIAHLGARASFAGPLGGPAGVDTVGDTYLALAARENVDCSHCRRVDGVPSPISAICIDRRGERAIVNYRDEGVMAARPPDADALAAGAAAGCARDANELLTQVTHVVCSAEGLRATAGTDHLGRALIDVSKQTKAFVAVTDGANDVLWLGEGELRQIPA